MSTFPENVLLDKDLNKSIIQSDESQNKLDDLIYAASMSITKPIHSSSPPHNRELPFRNYFHEGYDGFQSRQYRYPISPCHVNLSPNPMSPYPHGHRDHSFSHSRSFTNNSSHSPHWFNTQRSSLTPLSSCRHNTTIGHPESTLSSKDISQKLGVPDTLMPPGLKSMKEKSKSFTIDHIMKIQTSPHLSSEHQSNVFNPNYQHPGMQRIPTPDYYRDFPPHFQYPAFQKPDFYRPTQRRIIFDESRFEKPMINPTKTWYPDYAQIDEHSIQKINLEFQDNPVLRHNKRGRPPKRLPQI